MTFLERVLSSINKIRAALGKRPLSKIPRGFTWNSKTCPIARALGQDVGTRHIFFTTEKTALKVAKALRRAPELNSKWVLLPTVLRKFIKDFDERRYPEFDSGVKRGPIPR